MRQNISQKQFIEMYNGGERHFLGMELQFFDVSDLDLKGIHIKDSRILFCTFRNCDISDALFENCEIFDSGFCGGRMTKSVFERCTIELSLFENMQFDETKMHDCTVGICVVMGSNIASVDMTTSSQHRLMTDFSQFTTEDLEYGVSRAMAVISKFDISLRMKLREMMDRNLERRGLTRLLNKGDSHEDAKRYEITHEEVKWLVESSLGTYLQRKPYEMKRPYETSHTYRSDKTQ